MSVTSFGKFLRKIRIDQELIMKEMSDTLCVSAAQLSAMELGNRTIQKDIAQKIVENYNVENIELVNQLIDISQPSMKTDLKSANEKQRETMVMFARAFNEMSDKQLESVQGILAMK